MGIRIHKLSSYPDRRLTIAAGDFRIALHVPETFPDEETFCDPPGLPAQMSVYLSDTTDYGPISDRYLHRDARGYSFESPACRGTVDVQNGSGKFELFALRDDFTNRAIRPLLDIAMSACLDRIVRQKGIMLHACTLALNGKAYVFCGDSGRGKTTLYHRFIKLSADDPHVDAPLGDEWSMLAPDSNGDWHYWWYQYARGPFEARPQTLPLGGVFHIDEDRSQTAVKPMQVADAVAAVALSTYFVQGIEPQSLLDSAMALATTVPNARFSHCLTTGRDILAATVTKLRSAV